ncbi:MAG: hypothetical protein JWQ18_3289, partial [Conexibacter sp.]|nr:hypothetical protein [Conexibacter sp.]
MRSPENSNVPATELATAWTTSVEP